MVQFPKMRKIYQDKYKIVWQDERTGEVKEVPFKEVEGARADTLQPIGKDEREFFDRYRHLKKLPDGKIVKYGEEEL